MDDPAALVRAFMADYLAWNDRAFGDDENGFSVESMERADADYRTLLERYCRPGFRGEPISYGSHSAHDPAREVIVSVDTHGDTAVVTTRHTATHPSTFISDHEYRLAREGGRWYLEEIFYVDGEERYPSL